jgi:hypothetical protein
MSPLNQSSTSDFEKCVAEVYEPLLARIDAAYGLDPLTNIVESPDIVGASRLYYLPTWEPEDVVTLRFRADELSVDVIYGRISLEGLDNDLPAPPNTRHRTYSLHYGAGSDAISSPTDFFRRARDAGFCFSEVLDGIAYRHTFHDGVNLYDNLWSNPDPQNHPQQCELLKVYEGLLRRTWFRASLDKCFDWWGGLLGHGI